MRNSLKVARWEIWRMLHNKSFVISLLLSPLIMVIFGALPTLLAKLEDDQAFHLYVIDEVGIYQTVEQSMVDDNIVLHEYQGNVAELQEEVRGENRKGYVVLSPEMFETKEVIVTLGGDGMPSLGSVQQVIGSLIQYQQMVDYGLSSSQAGDVLQGVRFETKSLTSDDKSTFERLVPLVFVGILILAIYMTGIMALQSSLAEKKDRMAEVMLSAVESRNIMEGKIIGYFVLGLIQVATWLVFGAVALRVFRGMSLGKLLLVPNFPILLFFVLGGYMLYSAIFVSMGATMEDIGSASNMQGMIFVLPMLPIMLAPSILANPSGVIAKVGSYFPLTTSGVMIARMALSSKLSFLEMALPAAILLVTVYLVMKAAGKIFKTGMLMYGKTFSMREIFRWIRE